MFQDTFLAFERKSTKDSIKMAVLSQAVSTNGGRGRRRKRRS